MNNHTILSNVVCSQKNCNKKIKQSVLDKKQNISNGIKCFKCFQKSSAIMGKTMRTAKDIRKKPHLRSKKRENLPLKIKQNKITTK